MASMSPSANSARHMSVDGSQPKMSRYEWCDPSAGSKGAHTSPLPLVNMCRKEIRFSAIACTEKKAFIIGGQDAETQRNIRQVLEWDVTTKQWGRAMDLPEALSEAAAATFEDNCFVFGGWDEETYTDKLWLLAHTTASVDATRRTSKEASSSASMAWELLRPRREDQCNHFDAPQGRTGHSLVFGVATPSRKAHDEGGELAVEPVLYLFGGFDGDQRLNDAWRLWILPTLQTREAVWERVHTRQGIPPSPRDDAAVAFDLAEEKLYVFGGFSTSLTNDVFVLELKGGINKWAQPVCFRAPSRRHRSIAAINNGNLIVVSGEGYNNEHFAQVWQLSLADKKWSMLLAEQSQEHLLNRHGFAGGGDSRNGRILIYGGGVSTRYRASIVELELGRNTAAVRKK